MSALFKLIFRFNVIPTEIPTRFSVDINNFILKFV